MRTALPACIALAALACTPAAPRAETSAAASAVPIDVDTRDVGRTVHVLLESQAGTLLASPPIAEDAETEDDSDFQPWQCDTRAHETWASGRTVLAARSERSSENGTPGGWIGTLLPWAAGAVAVRSWTVDWAERGIGERDDELVAIGLPDVSMRAVYTPGGRLRLMGVIAGHAIVLVSSRDGSHHVVAVSADGQERARSEAVAPSAEVLGAYSAGTELGLPEAAALDASTIAFPCTESGELCLVRFDGTAMTLAHTGLPIADGLAITDHGLAVMHGDDCHALATGEDFAPCGEGAAAYPEEGLPVDGTITLGVEADVALAEVRSEVALEPPDPDSEELTPRGLAGVVLLGAPEGGATGVGFDLLVRGDHLAVSYTRVDDTSAASVRRDLALALPPGSVRAERIELDGALAYRVRVESSFPIHYSHDCWQGFWVVRAWYEGGGEAFSQTYAEYGYCD